MERESLDSVSGTSEGGEAVSVSEPAGVTVEPSSASAETTGTRNEKEPARKRVRGASRSNDLLYSEFIKLNEHYKTKTGKEYPSYWCVCKHCEAKKVEWQKKYPNQTVGCPVSRRLNFVLRDCQNHLKNCKHYYRACYAEKRAALYYEGKIPSLEDSARPRKAPPPSAAVAGPSSVAAASEVSSLGGSPWNTPQSIGVKKPATMHKYMSPKMTASDMSRSLNFIAEWIVDTGQPFNCVERGSFRRMIDSFRPRASELLPYRKKIRSVIMTMASAAQKDVKDMIEDGKQAGRRIGVTVDGWNGVNKKHVDGVMVKVGCLVYPGDCEECGTDHDGVNVARSWDDLCARQDKDWSYLTTDNAGQCGRARRILARRYPEKLFNCCWAHQLNLMVKHLLQHSEFADVASSAASVAKALNKSSSKWLPKLNDKINVTYGFVHTRATKVMTVCDTRWNSTQACFASQLRIRHAMRVYAIENSCDGSFPNPLKILEDNSYWHKLGEAELLIRPFCEASFLMQRVTNTMAHVMLVLLNMAKHISDFCRGEETMVASASVILDIEKRWMSQENHLFFLTFAFHPAFRAAAHQILRNSLAKRGSWTDKRNPLTTVRVAHAARFYYEKFNLFSSQDDAGQKRELANVAKQVGRYLRTPSFLPMPYNDGEDPHEWWDFFKDENPEVAVLAQFLLDAPVQSADVERLFKSFSEFLSDKRNRLNTDALFGSACVKDSLKRKYPEDLVDQDGAKRHSKNRFVNPEEYKKAAQQTQDSTDTHGNMERVATEQMVERDNDTPSEDANDEEEQVQQEQETDKRLPGEDDFSHLLRALTYLDTQETTDDSSDDDSEGNNATNVNELDVEDNGDGSLPNEDPPEKRDFAVVLEQIPNMDDRRYPQENTAYFRRKRYCRNDKYSLLNMINGDLELPSIASAFKNT